MRCTNLNLAAILTRLAMTSAALKRTMPELKIQAYFTRSQQCDGTSVRAFLSVFPSHWYFSSIIMLFMTLQLKHFPVLYKRN